MPLAVLALGGEALGITAWQAIQGCARTAMSAFNCYGPTETTVEAVVAAVNEHARAGHWASDPDHPRPRNGLLAAAGA